MNEHDEFLRASAAADRCGCIVDIGARDRDRLAALLSGARSGANPRVYSVFDGSSDDANGGDGPHSAGLPLAADEGFADLRRVDLPPADVAAAWKQPVGLLVLDRAGDYWGARRTLLRWLPHMAEGGTVLIAGGASEGSFAAEIAADALKMPHIRRAQRSAGFACLRVGVKIAAMPMMLSQLVPPPVASPFARYAANVTSQNGEDGIIAAIFERIGVGSRWCVEFGAWDGRHLSNTYRLLAEEGWSGVPIEGDPAKFVDLQSTYAAMQAVHPLNAYVGFEGDQTLDRLLARTPCPRAFDLLSIDIDGNDWHVWRALTEYRPRVVVIEFDSTVTNDVIFVQAPNPSVNQGCSLRALVMLGREKGYRLAATTLTNAIFVVEEEFAQLGVDDSNLDRIHTPSCSGRLFHCFDGTIYAIGMPRFEWYPYPSSIAPDALQALAPEDRVFPHPGWRREGGP